MSSPVDSNALGQDLGNRHSLSTYRGGFISCFCRERGIGNQCVSLPAGTRANDSACRVTLDAVRPLSCPRGSCSCTWEVEGGDVPVACPRLCSPQWTWSQISWMLEQSLLPADPFQSGALSSFPVVPAFAPLAIACLWVTCH